MDLVDGLSLPLEALAVSAINGFGFESLTAAIKQKLGVETPVESGFTSRRRHLTALMGALNAAMKGREEFEVSHSGELLAEELRECQTSLGQIFGEFSADDLLGEIFSSFCIGK